MLTAAVTEVVDHPCIKHAWASSTAIYTSVGSDFKNRMLRVSLERVLAAENDEEE